MFQYITTNPEILGGKPCLKGTRLSVEFILELFASGATHEDILKVYPTITFPALKELLSFSLKNRNS